MDSIDAPVYNIKPPPKILGVIEKAAKFVTQYGKQFEQRIRQTAKSSAAEQAKFAFLDEGHVYHSFYVDLLARKSKEKNEPSKAAETGEVRQDDGQQPRAADDTDEARDKRSGIAKGGDRLTALPTVRAAMIDVIGQIARSAERDERLWAEKSESPQANRHSEEESKSEDQLRVQPPPPQLHPPAPMPQSSMQRQALLLAAQLAAIGGREAVARAAARAAREAADSTGTLAEQQRRQRRAELLRVSLQQSSPYHPTFRDAAAAYSRVLRLPPADRARLEADARDPWRRRGRATDSTETPPSAAAGSDGGGGAGAGAANPGYGTTGRGQGGGGQGVLARAARRGAARRRAAAARSERRQVAQAGWKVDWYDFVVVYTLDDDEWPENLPAPEPLRRSNGELAPAAVHESGGGGGGSGSSGGAAGMLSQAAMARALAAARRRKAEEEAREERARAGHSVDVKGAQGGAGDGNGKGGDDVDMDMDEDDDDEDDAMDMDAGGVQAPSSRSVGAKAAASSARGGAARQPRAAVQEESLGPSLAEMAGAADDEEIRVIEDYAPGRAGPARAPVGAGSGVFVNPATGERVPVQGVQQAMRIGLIDQRTYQEQQKREKEKKSTSALVPDEMIGDSLMRMGRQRTDIFGGSEQQAQAEAKAASAYAMNTAASGGVWDGQIASIDQVRQAQQQGPGGPDVGQKRAAEGAPGAAGGGTQKRPRTG